MSMGLLGRGHSGRSRPHDEYINEMLALSLSQIEETIQPGLASSFDLFGHVGIVEGASDFVDPPLYLTFCRGSSPVSDVVFYDPSMDLSMFEYLPASRDIALLVPSSPTSQIFDIDDDIAQHDSMMTHLRFRFRPHERDSLIQLLRSYLDVFAWSYEDMPGLDPSIVQHRLPLLPHARPVKQKLRRLHPRWSLQVKEEIQKQLSVGFLSVVEYPEWLANVVPVPKKDGKYGRSFDVVLYGRIFRVQSDLDGSKGMEKTSFITEWALERFFERIRQFRLRLNPKKCTFGVTSGKLLGYMVSERGIEVDPDKIRAILDMPAEDRERGQRLPGQTSVHHASVPSRGSESTCCHLLLAPPTPGRPLLLYLSVSDVALGCMLAQLDDSGKDRAIYYLSKRMLDYETRYVMIERYLALVWATRRLRHYMTEYSVHLISKSIRGSIVADHLASLPVSDARAIDDDFPDEDVAAVTSLSWWRMYFDGAANHSGYGIGVLLISPHGDHIPRSRALELGIRQMEVFGDSNLVLRQIQGEWKTRDVKLKPYHAYLELLVGRFDDLRYTHLPRAQNQFADALATLASMIDIPVDATAITDGMLLLCLDRASADRVMREVHAGVCGPHMGGHMLARKIMRTGYFWLTMETDCCQFVQRCPECQIHGDLIHVPPSELHALTSPWPFSVWGIDIIGKISPKSSSGHEFILVAIDYFTKWVEAPLQIQHPHHRSSAYRPQTNGAVEAANKNIKRILRRMVETSRDWSEKLPFALWAYRTSFRTSTGATPYSLVYGMEAMLPVEIEMGSLRVALEQQIPEADWAQARFDQLNLLDERRLRAADHVRVSEEDGPRFQKAGQAQTITDRGRCMVDGFRWKPILRANQCGSAKEASSGPWLMGSLYMLHFIYEGMSFDHWVFEPSFLSFLSPYHLGLRYVPCLKTTLRPWDQMSSSQPLLGQVIEIWLNLDIVMLLLLGVASLMCRSDSVVFGLPGSFMDPHRLARSLSLTGCSLRRGHVVTLRSPEIHPASRTSRHLDAIMPLHLGGHLGYMCMIQLWIRMTIVTCSTIDDFMSCCSSGLSRT
ncbi:hypothetical protein CK203_063798 [Vitis vinifera]|uniref:Uncharacterized protein n=1 Tax=Vitis vinifera TaxID=29760 RepID=A0A438G800_VITVI|nr:hypothetical protein CK203_063798 [Vitis vinifera]